MAGEAEALAETPEQRGHARMLRKFTEESLVNLDKPNGISESGRLQNIDPHDRLKVEEVPR
jgi:hypothetical protein